MEMRVFSHTLQLVPLTCIRKWDKLIILCDDYWSAVHLNGSHVTYSTTNKNCISQKEIQKISILI